MVLYYSEIQRVQLYLRKVNGPKKNGSLIVNQTDTILRVDLRLLPSDNGVFFIYPKTNSFSKQIFFKQ